MKAKFKRFDIPEDFIILLDKFLDNKVETHLYAWAISLYNELELVKSTLQYREDSYEYFLLRLFKYKREFPNLGESGDFTLIKRIILAEIRLDELDRMDLSALADNPKLIDAITKLHTQLMKDTELLGTTSRQKKKDTLEELKIFISINTDVLGDKLQRDERETFAWLEDQIALTEGKV